MKKSSSLFQKLSSYSAFTGSVLAMTSNVNAQVVYHDVSPDDTLMANSFDNLLLDLNNDGDFDFRLRVGWASTGNFALITNWDQQNANPKWAIGSHPADYYDFPYILQSGDSICPDTNWITIAYLLNGTLFYRENGSTIGNWQGGVSDKFIGLRFRTPDFNLHYAWVRIDLAADASLMIVKDYACNETPDACIIAGEGIPSGQQDNIKNSAGEIFIVTNPVANQLVVSGITPSLDGGQLSIIDLEGRTLLSQNASQNTSDKNLSVDVSNLLPGIYFLELKTKNRSETKKFEIHR